MDTVKYEDFKDGIKRDQFGKVPVHNDDAFLHGVVCKAKFIGSMETPRSFTKCERMNTLRRVRRAYKARNVDKIKVNISVAVSGLCVTKRTKKRCLWRSESTFEELPEVIFESPINRVFYAMHDSMDRHIFGLVYRAEVDGGRKCFMCAVFKASKKSHASRIVFTIDQSFDIMTRLTSSGIGTSISGVMPPAKSGGEEARAEAVPAS